VVESSNQPATNLVKQPQKFEKAYAQFPIGEERRGDRREVHSSQQPAASSQQLQREKSSSHQP